MRRIVLFMISILLVSTRLASAGASDQRVALLIGNSNYLDAPLKNPVNDATDMASALKKLGFKVTLKTNANQRTMKQSIRAFGKQLARGGVGLFYFAGHGIQSSGRNYLIPVHAEVQSEADVEYEAVDAGRVLAQMERAGNHLNIIILDACRNNPFARSFRSASRGLAKMDAPTGSILAYATAPGSVAADGEGRNGLYTAKLLKHMAIPGLEIGRVFREVRKDVVKASRRRQTPWESSSLMGDFYFNPKEGESTSAARAIAVQKRHREEKLNAEEETWKIVSRSSVIEDYRLFMDQYPDSRFNTAAQLKIQQLKREAQAQRLTALTPQHDLAPGEAKNGPIQKGNSNLYKYRAAVFPVLQIGHDKNPKGLYTPIANTFSSVNSGLKLFDLIYAPSDLINALSGAKPVDIRSVITDSDFEKKIWERNWMSRMNPNIDIVCEYGHKLGVDVVLMYQFMVGRGEDTMRIMMVSIQKRNYLDKGLPYFHTDDGPTDGLNRLTRDLFQKYE